MECTSDYIMVADAQGMPVVFNTAYAQVMSQALGIEMRPGIQPHKLLGDPEAVAFWDELHRRVLGGERFSVEFPQEFPGGAVRSFSVSFNPIVADGEVRGFAEITREVTERVRATTALEESERTLRESQEVARIGSYRLDIATNHWSSSTILDQIFGIDGDYARTVKSWSQILHLDFRDEMLEYFAEEVLAKRQRFDKEYVITRISDGADRWVHGLGRLELDSDGNPVRMIGTVRDITERKEMEQRIRQQEKMESIGLLAGGVAHDFNNQLVGIMGFADLLRIMLPRDSKLGLYAENILIGAKHAADLTNQLLAFSRKGKYLSAPVDIHRIVFEVINVLQHTVDKRIDISQRLEASGATTLGDPTQLQSAVLNLALNARDAMPDGGAILFATEVVQIDRDSSRRLAFEVEPGEYVRVSVTDTGAGIDQDIQARIFEPFVTTKGLGKGTGMGLAAVYGTAKNHHGGVSVDSSPGRGTTMSMYLPLASTDQHVINQSAFRKRADRSSAHVFFVDDEASVRNVGVAMLESAGFRVTTSTNGAEAVESYREGWKQIDLVVLDMVMPVLGGHNAFLAMREINPDVRVLLASGYSLNEEAQGLLDLGAIGFIQKPFRIEALLDVVVSALSEA